MAARPPVHPLLLQARTYPFVTEIRTRYADMDPYKHINNVAIAAIYEETRVALLRSLVERHGNLERGGWLVAELQIRYFAEIPYPSTLQVTGAITHVGHSSIRFSHALFLAGRCMGYCDTVGVHSHGSGAVEIPPNWRAALLGVKIELAPITG